MFSARTTLHTVFSRALFWSLAPLVYPQGVRVRRTATRFEEADGPRTGTVGDGPTVRLLGIGDSIMAGVGIPSMAQSLPARTAAALAPKLAARVAWHAVGQAGARTSTVHRHLVPQMDPLPYDIIATSVGINDVTALKRTHAFRTDLVALVGVLRSHSPNAHIVFCGLPPIWGFPLLPQPLRFTLGVRARTFDRIAEAEVHRLENCSYLATGFDPRPDKFAPDGYHPSAASCDEWGRILAAHLANELSQRPAR